MIDLLYFTIKRRPQYPGVVAGPVNPVHASPINAQFVIHLVTRQTKVETFLENPCYVWVSIVLLKNASRMPWFKRQHIKSIHLPALHLVM